jgi:hypothetical protein
MDAAGEAEPTPCRSSAGLWDVCLLLSAGGGVACRGVPETVETLLETAMFFRCDRDGTVRHGERRHGQKMKT